ncbi:MAG: hypothetical protein H0T51_16370 [Pirellulales bacterium]|nr:hypothetical protein [Pirellulales bacterium]
MTLLFSERAYGERGRACVRLARSVSGDVAKRFAVKKYWFRCARIAARPWQCTLVQYRTGLGGQFQAKLAHITVDRSRRVSRAQEEVGANLLGMWQLGYSPLPYASHVTDFPAVDQSSYISRPIMAKTKAELEYDFDQHQKIMARVRTANRSGEISKALDLAVTAWEYIDGMMQYEKRYGSRSEFKTIDSIAFVLSYAPILFETTLLARLATLLRTYKRIEKNTTDEIGLALDNAMSLMWEARKVWNLLETEGEVHQADLGRRLGGEQARLRDLVESWVHLGVVQRRPHGSSYLIRLCTRVDEKTQAKCSVCGIVDSDAMMAMLDPRRCPNCGCDANFVILPTAS